MKESEVVDFLREWFIQSGYTVRDFHVKDGNGRPDMVVSNDLGYFTAIEVKRSNQNDIFLAHKIINYALDHWCNGAKYLIDDTQKNITNFLVATEYSLLGRLFKYDIDTSNEWNNSIKGLDERCPQCMPKKEWQRSADFTRDLWRWFKKDREKKKELENVNVGVLLSTVNDKKKAPLIELDGNKKDLIIQHHPKMFVMHFSKKRAWGTWWYKL